MSADPTTPPAAPAPVPRWRRLLREHPKVFAAALALAAAAAGALLDHYGFGPRTVEVVTEIIRETPLPVSADPTGPIDYEGMRFHGDADEHGHDAHGGHPLQAQEARWPTDRITYGIDYASARGTNPPLSDEAVRNEARIAFGWWSEHLKIEFVEVPFAAAMIPNNFARIDGPGKVLARAYLADGTSRPKPLTLDASERWVAGPGAANQVSLRTVWCHEIGHSLGLDHDADGAPAVMRPTYTAAIPREQERDIARAVRLGYARREKVPAAPSDVLSFPVQAKTDDVADVMRKAGFTVTRP